MFRNGAKFIQRRLYSYINTWAGFTVFLILCYFLVATIIESLSNSCSLRGLHSHCSLRHAADNIAFRDLEGELRYQPFDVVYTWVNGSDPRWKAKKERFSNPKGVKKEVESHNVTLLFSNHNHTSTDTHHNFTIPALNESAVDADDTMSLNRYRDSEELRFSLRSLVKNAPWIRHIYIVTDNQVPYWLNLESTRLTVITHEEIFPNKSHLPVFSSPAIEANLHRIPGLSKKFIYFNDDVFLGAKVLPEDFISLRGAQRLIMSWDVPKCAPGCSDSWIGDGFCDKACNVSACNFDFPDCVNGTNSNSHTNHQSRPSSSLAMCNKGCPDNWLADKICDQRCKNLECGYDVGDCGFDLVYSHYPGVTIDTSNARIQSMSSIYAPNMEYGPTFGSYSYGDPSRGFFEDSLSLEQISEGFESELTNTTVVSDVMNTANSTEAMENSVVFLNTTSNGTAGTTVSTNIHTTTKNAHKAITALYPALTVEYGTYAVYFDLAYLGCMYSLNVTCIPEQVKDVTYEKAEHDDEEGLLIHSTTLLTRHHTLVVLLYHGQDGVLPFTKPSLDVKFTITVTSSVTSESTSAVFTLRVLAQGSVTTTYPAELVPVDMVLLSNQSYVKECADVPPGNREWLTLRDMKILAHPYATPIGNVILSNVTATQPLQEQGAIVSAMWSIASTSSMNEVARNRILVRYTLTTVTGVTHRITLSPDKAILIFTQSALGNFFGPLNLSEDTPDNHFQSIMTAVERSSELFDQYVTSQLPPRAARFLPHQEHMHQNLPISTLIEEHHNATSITNITTNGLETEFTSANMNVPLKDFKHVNMHLKIPFPHKWQEQGASMWYHIHADILTIAEDRAESIPVCAYSWVENRECMYNATQLGAFTAVVKWGADKSATNGTIIDTLTNSSIANVNPEPPALNTIAGLDTENSTISVNNATHTTNIVSSTSATVNNSEPLFAITDPSSRTSTDITNSTDSTVPDPQRRLSAYTAHTTIYSLLQTISSQLATSLSTLCTTMFHVLTGMNQEDTKVKMRRRLEDTYGQSLVHVNRLYTKTFGTEGRKVPAHVPHMIDKDYMIEMQERWPEQWNATSAHRFRSPTDMQYSFSYYYYLSNRIKVKPHDLTKHVRNVLDTDKDGYLNENEFRSLAAMVKGSQSPSTEYIHTLLDCIANNSATFHRQHTESVRHFTPRGQVVKSFQLYPHPSIAEALNCSEIENGLQQNVPWSTLYPSHVHESDKDIVAFEMIGDDFNTSLGQLDSVRQRQSKFVCINDNMKNPSKELEQALRSFYLSFFPEPCVFELPPGTRNPTLYLDEYQELKRQQSHLAYRITSLVVSVPKRVARGVWQTMRIVLLPLVRHAEVVLSEEDNEGLQAQGSDVYVNGLRQDIATYPRYKKENGDEEWQAFSRNVLLLSVVGVVGFAVLRLIVRRNSN